MVLFLSRRSCLIISVDKLSVVIVLSKINKKPVGEKLIIVKLFGKVDSVKIKTLNISLDFELISFCYFIFII